MKKTFLYIVIGLLAVFLTGCVKTPNVNFNGQMHNNLKSIAIVPPQKIEEVNIFYFNHPGMNFGLIGGLAAAAEFSSKTSTYNKLILPTKFDANAYFLSKLVKYLKKENYKVTLLPLDPKRSTEHMKNYPEVQTDAYLDVFFGDVGFIAGGPSSTYKPTVKVAARLVKKLDKSILYDKHLAIGENFALAQEVDYIGCDTEECHKDFDALKKNAIKSVNGLKKALDKIAKRLATSLKRG